MPQTPPVPALDHVVVAARDRTSIEKLLSEAGLTAGSSRVIPGAGLSNIVVAVGTQLLEFHHPDGNEAAPGAPPFAQIQATVLAAHPEVDLIPVAWLIRFPTADLLRAASARVQCPVAEVPAEPPNNAAHLLGALGPAFTRPWLPAFLHWLDAPHVPPRLADDHDGPVAGQIGLEVSGPEDELRDWCGGWPDGVSALPGRAGPQRVSVHRPGLPDLWIGVPQAS